MTPTKVNTKYKNNNHIRSNFNVPMFFYKKNHETINHKLCSTLIILNTKLNIKYPKIKTHIRNILNGFEKSYKNLQNKGKTNIEINRQFTKILILFKEDIIFAKNYESLNSTLLLYSKCFNRQYDKAIAEIFDKLKKRFHSV